MPRVTFSRKGLHFCIYCGKPSNTREHCPSKVFLEKPYPDDLPVLPACFECNNSFSSDELYTKMYMDSIGYSSGFYNNISPLLKKHMSENTAFNDAKRDYEYYIENGFFPENNKILRILTKLAICHLVYELYECYSIEGCEVQPSMIKYTFLLDKNVSSSQIKEPIILEHSLPMVGTRVYNHIFVCEPITSHPLAEPILIMEWTDVQQYCYVTWMDSDESFKVRLLINDLLYAEITFPQSSD